MLLNMSKVHRFHLFSVFTTMQTFEFLVPIRLLDRKFSFPLASSSLNLVTITQLANDLSGSTLYTVLQWDFCQSRYQDGKKVKVNGHSGLWVPAS